MTVIPQPEHADTATGSAADPDAPRPGDALVKAGGIVFIVGAVATLATMAPLFLDTDPFPSYAWAVCMLMGVGFAISAAGVLRSAAAQRTAARASQAQA